VKDQREPSQPKLRRFSLVGLISEGPARTVSTKSETVLAGWNDQVRDQRERSQPNLRRFSLVGLISEGPARTVSTKSETVLAGWNDQ